MSDGIVHVGDVADNRGTKIMVWRDPDGTARVNVSSGMTAILAVLPPAERDQLRELLDRAAMPGQPDMHRMTAAMGAWCGTTGPVGARATSAWAEVTCPACHQQRTDGLLGLVLDMLDTMPASKEALGFAVRAGQLGTRDHDGNLLVPACAPETAAMPGQGATEATPGPQPEYQCCEHCAHDIVPPPHAEPCAFKGCADGSQPKAAAGA